MYPVLLIVSFFFIHTPTTEIYTLSLHDALPIFIWMDSRGAPYVRRVTRGTVSVQGYGVDRLARWLRTTGGIPAHSGKDPLDRKSTRLNSSHVSISYAVFCLKKKINNIDGIRRT